MNLFFGYEMYARQDIKKVLEELDEYLKLIRVLVTCNVPIIIINIEVLYFSYYS